MRIAQARHAAAFIISRAFFYLLLLNGASLECQSRTAGLSGAFRGSLLFFPEDNGLESDIGHILPSLGAALTLPVLGPLCVEASFDLYGADYEYRLDRPVAANPENRAAYVIGSILGIQLLGRFDIGPFLTLRVYGGPAADIRLCLLSYGLTGDPQESELRRQTEEIAAYFWDQCRWFLPVAGIGFDYRILPKVMLGLDVRAWFPLYRYWTGEELPPIEGWRFGGGIRVSLR
ncbi:MAG: hypothetical protein LBG76_11330 [Treponema sp.]|jgi:hypothetical protein|nr:hypothetical protein [Treponema sp.]